MVERSVLTRCQWVHLLHTQMEQSSPTETSCFSSGLHFTEFTREE